MRIGSSQKTMMGAAGAAGGSDAWWLALSTSPSESSYFSSVVVASDDTVIVAGNRDNQKNHIVSFDTNGNLINFRNYESQSYSFRKEGGVDLKINSNDKIAVSWVEDRSGTRYGAGMVINKDLTSYMSGNKFLTAGNRNWSGDFKFTQCAIQDDNVFYWNGLWVDGFQDQFGIFQFDAASNSQGWRSYNNYPNTPHPLVPISNTNLVCCLSTDYTNDQYSKIVVINSTQDNINNGSNTVWRKLVGWQSSGYTRLHIRDVVFDGTYIYAVADGYEVSTDGLGVIKLNTSGTIQYHKRHKLSGLSSSQFSGVQCCHDGSGNMFFVGENSYYQTDRIVFGKIDSSGNTEFVHEITPTGNWSRSNVNNGGVRSGIACDSSGYPYIATTWNNGSFDKPVLMKLNPDGNTVGTFADVTISAIGNYEESSAPITGSTSEEMDVYSIYDSPTNNAANTNTNQSGGSFTVNPL